MSARRNRKEHEEVHRDLKEVFKAMGPVEAEVVKSYLESNGISSVLMGKVAQSIYPIATNGMGEIRIMVQPDEFETAVELLKDFNPEKG